MSCFFFSAADDPHRSQASFIIAAAQVREELQCEGDTLNEQIKQSEKQVQVLNKHLKKVLSDNHSFKAGFQEPQVESEEMKLRLRCVFAYGCESV